MDAILIEDAELTVYGQSGVGKCRAESQPPLVEAVAVPDVAHKANPPRAAVDHAADENHLAGDALHRDEVAADERLVGAGIPVHEDRRLSQRADHLDVSAVEELDAKDAGRLIKVDVGGQRQLRQFLGRDLVHLHGISRARDPVGEARDEVGPEVVAQELVLRQDRHGPRAASHGLVLCGEAVVAQLVRRCDDEALRGVWHRSSSVEDLGHRVAAISDNVEGCVDANSKVMDAISNLSATSEEVAASSESSININKECENDMEITKNILHEILQISRKSISKI